MKNSKLVHCTTASALDIINACESFSVGGSGTSLLNNQLIRDCYSHWLLLPLEAVGSKYTKESMRIRLNRVSSQVVNTDFNTVIDVLNGLYYALITHDIRGDKTHNKRLAWNWINQYCVEYVTDFKGPNSPDISLILDLIAPIERELIQYLTQRSVTDLRHVVSWLRFPAKLSLSVGTLEEEALLGFLQTEERLAALSLEEVDEIPALNAIMRRWLGAIDLTFLPVRHGSGSVAEGNLTKAEKYSCLGIDDILDKVLNGWIVGPKHGYDYYLWDPRHVEWQRTSRVQFVPKSATKLRTICMEPATLQYFQQGVMRVLYDYISSHPFLGNRINLRDQTQNQDAAQLGSATETYATIDLSAASDSVSWDLARRLFHGTPLLKWMIATRSTHCELPNGDIIKSGKFAPMGSALCFPIECLIFASVVELVAEEQEYTTLDGHDSWTFWSVYGDDIVIPSNWYPRITDILFRLGFLVNDDKSYHEGPFRESCGGEYYLGKWITPIYYRLDKPLHDFITPSTYVKLLTSANNAMEAGYTFLRSRYLEEAVTLGKKGLARNLRKLGPCYTDTFSTPPFVFSPTPTNYTNGIRWNKGLMRREIEYLAAASKKQTVTDYSRIEEDHILYHEWLIKEFWHPKKLEMFEDFNTKRKWIVPEDLVWKRGIRPLA